MNLQSPIEDLKGVGQKIAVLLQRLGIRTLEDLIWHLPRRYDDYSKLTSIEQLKPGPVSIQASFKQVTSRYVRRGLHISEAIASDTTGSVRVVWFNQPYRAKQLKSNSQYFISGKYEFSNRRYVIANPACEQVSSFPKNAARIIPIYKETKGLTSHQLRKLIAQALPIIQALPEEMPQEVLDTHDLVSLSTALSDIHFPSSSAGLELARKRLAFDELFSVLFANQLLRSDNAQAHAQAIPFDESAAKDFVERLGFTLTNAQRRAAWDVLQDMTRDVPMNRLIEGDVGSGKTVVAAMAIVMAVRAGFQVAVIAPTEILAQQHTETLQELLAHTDVQLTLLSGGLTAKAKRERKQQLSSGAIEVVVGTHALLEDSVEFSKLGLAIIDEQHRFGVQQRRKLQQKAGGSMPHLLSMTATPIPRTLALTVFGELDISIIDELPPGRKKTISRLISPNSRKQLYQLVVEQLTQGRQVFMVYPLIEESETLNVKDAQSAFDALAKRTFKSYRVGLIHGRLDPQSKQAVMDDFVAGNLDILVSTTVIEVGVNVPNATVMIIESAERFGLAQLHQLRGRVGRSHHQAYCYLVTTSSQEPPMRLKRFVDTHDGFKLAELDLELRGPGEIYGAMQHGALDLRVAKLSDTKLIASAQESARELVKTKPDLLDYPVLAKRVQKLKALTYLN